MEVYEKNALRAFFSYTSILKASAAGASKECREPQQKNVLAAFIEQNIKNYTKLFQPVKLAWRKVPKKL